MLNSVSPLPSALRLGGAPTPSAAATSPAASAGDALTLDSYTPHVGRYVPLAGWPVAGAALGAVAASSSTVAIVAGALAGGTVGLMLGASLGKAIDKLRGQKDGSLAGKLAFAGCLVGGVLGGLGGSIIPASAATVALGFSGAALGVGIAVAMTKNVGENHAKKVDARARSGDYRLSELFSGVTARNGIGSPTLTRQARAMERLEAAGWRFGADRETFEEHARGEVTEGTHVLPPSGGRYPFSLESLPTVAWLSGLANAEDVEDLALVEGVQRAVSQGREMRCDSWRHGHEPASNDEATLRLAEVCDMLRHGQTVEHHHDGVTMHIVARDGAALERALKTLDDQIAQYDRHLAPLFASGALSADHKTAVHDELLRAPVGSDLGRGVPLLMKLVDARPQADVRERTRRGLEMFGALSRLCNQKLPFDRAVDDAVTLSSRFDDDAIAHSLSVLGTALSTVTSAKVDPFHEAFVRALASTGDRPETAVRAAEILTCLDPQETENGLRMLERLSSPSPTDDEAATLATLTRAASRQPGYGDVRVDYATLMALRDESASLADTTHDYEILLSGLTSLNQAAEAAPTYAFIRSGLKHGRFGHRTYERLLEDFFTACAAGAQPRRARENLLHTAPTSDSTVKKDDDVVIIGGIPVPVRH